MQSRLSSMRIIDFCFAGAFGAFIHDSVCVG